MALGLLDLNEDCQREIIKKMLLDSEAKIVRLVDTDSRPSMMTIERPVATNAFTLVNKAIHALFEDELRKYQVIELRSLGWRFGTSLTKWNFLRFKDVRYLRLILDFTKPQFTTATGMRTDDVQKSLLEVAQLLTRHLQGLIDLQLVVQVDVFTFVGTDKAKDELRAFALHRFVHEMDRLSKLQAVYVWYVNMHADTVFSLPHSTKLKTAKGWRHDMNSFSMGYCSSKARQALQQMVESIGLKSGL